MRAALVVALVFSHAGCANTASESATPALTVNHHGVAERLLKVRAPAESTDESGESTQDSAVGDGALVKVDEPGQGSPEESPKAATETRLEKPELGASGSKVAFRRVESVKVERDARTHRFRARESERMKDPRR